MGIDINLEIVASAFTSKNSNLVRSVENNELPSINTGQISISVELVGVELNTKPSDDKFVFHLSFGDKRKAQAFPIEFTRKKLEETFSHQDLIVLMVTSYINDSCIIGEESYCECCDFEDRCMENREAAAYARIPANADLSEVRAIMEAPDYYENLATACWKIDEAIAVRLMPISVDTSQRHDPTPEIAALKGTRLVTASEGEKAQRLTESLIKSLTGGDKLTVRSLYGECVSFTNGS